MGACYATDSADEAAGPMLRPGPCNREEGRQMAEDEIVRIMRGLREIHRQMVDVRPDLGNRLNDLIEQLGELEIAIEFESYSQ